MKSPVIGQDPREAAGARGWGPCKSSSGRPVDRFGYWSDMVSSDMTFLKPALWATFHLLGCDFEL